MTRSRQKTPAMPFAHAYCTSQVGKQLTCRINNNHSLYGNVKIVRKHKTQDQCKNQLHESRQFTNIDPQRLGMKFDHVCLHWKMSQLLK